MAIGRWSRGPTLGRGSTAIVFLSAASPSGHLFAVKSAELSVSAPLRREHAILSSLRHPNIVSCLGFDVAAEAPHGRLSYNLFLEYAPLGSLSDLMSKRGGRLEEAAIRCYAGDILRGLAYLHANSIAHCDVKSGNVLLWPGGRAKLADLGCARRERDGGSGRPVVAAGTPMFMAPEVARGEEQGAAADVWALGCTVIEMATGRPPWPDVVDPVAALHRIGYTSEVPKCPMWLSSEAEDFVGKCLRRDAKERWTTEQLLRHPFVGKPSSENCFLESSVDQVWVSPKSILEQGLWDSVADKEEQEEEAVEERIKELAGDGFPATNWMLDDSWLTVRGITLDDDDDDDGEEEEEDEEEEEEEVTIDNSIIDQINPQEEHSSDNLIVERLVYPILDETQLSVLGFAGDNNNNYNSNKNAFFVHNSLQFLVPPIDTKSELD